MSGVAHLLENVKIPKFVRVKQSFPHNEYTEEQIIQGFLK